MSKRQGTAALYTVLVVANAGLTALGVVLANGSAPVPAEWAWVMPVAVAMITALTAQLPSVRSSEQSGKRRKEVRYTYGHGEPPAGEW